MNFRPLEGLRVLDLSRLLPGPLATQLLVKMGAKVTKVESPHKRDETYYIPPLSQGISKLYLSLNEKKELLFLDLKDPDDQRKFFRIVKDYDCIVESFRKGFLDELGIGYKQIKKVNPKIVVCSVYGFPSFHPSAHKASHDLNYMAESGILESNRHFQQKPVIPNFQVADLAGGSLGSLVGLLSGLYQAQKTGNGLKIEISMLDGVKFLQYIPLSMRSSPEMASCGLLSGGYPNYQVYATKDNKFVALAAFEKKFWANFCEHVHKAHLIPMYMDKSKSAFIQDELNLFFLGQTRDYWEEDFRQVDCCFSPVLSFEEACQRESRIEKIRKEESEYEIFPLPWTYSD